MANHLAAILVYVWASPCAWAVHRRAQYGLLCVAQYSQAAGRPVKVHGVSANDDPGRILLLLKEHNCNILGFYVDHENQWDVRRLISHIKNTVPHVDVILGGPQATANPTELLQRIPQAKCAVIGEGEQTFLELLDALPHGVAALNSCRGIAYLRGQDVVLTEPRPLIADLDSLPAPRVNELLVEDLPEQPAAILTGRGCSGHCAFCFEGRVQPLNQNRIRFRSIDNCLEEVAYLVNERAAKYVTIMDDTFVASPSRLTEFCQKMIQRYRGDLKWFCEARVDTLARNKGLIPLMVEAGLIRLQIGAESGSQQVLDAYRKNVTIAQIQEVVSECAKAGVLSLYANFIIGGAYETRHTFRQTLELALDLLSRAPGCASVGHSFFTPYPATPISERPESYGIHIIDSDAVTGSEDADVFCRTDELTRRDIAALGAKFKHRIQRRMNLLCRKIPTQQIDRLFQARHKYGLSTEWHQMLACDPLLLNYYQSLYSGSLRHFPQEIPDQIFEWVPVRLADLIPKNEATAYVRTPKREVLEIDALDTLLLRLSSGKLTLGDIVDLVSAQTATSKRRTTATVFSRYRYFDKQRILLYRGTGSAETTEAPPQFAAH